MVEKDEVVESDDELNDYLPSRVYQNINNNKPRDYWDYENSTIKWKEPDNYEVSEKIGRGRYSEVFQGNSIIHRKKCVIKMLKPVKEKKILREVKILQALSGAKNVIQLLDLVKDKTNDIPCIVFEYVNNTNFRELYPTFSDLDCRYYVDQILIGLESCHSRGIVHRDIKPHNIVIDHQKRELKIIDWGLAEFYFPNKKYNIRVASRYYKAPEILIDLRRSSVNRNHGYGLDMWSLGCLVAALLFRIETFFKGFDIYSQLGAIVRVLGKKDLLDYCKKFDLEIDPRHLGEMKKAKYEKKELISFINDDNSHLTSYDGIDFIEKLLKYDHNERMTAKEAMLHKWFEPIPNRNLSERGL
tara:strand:- start:1504 stop:2574 length:1071 start_codon:yes stop_codon:yes gene_type:complete